MLIDPISLGLAQIPVGYGMSKLAVFRTLQTIKNDTINIKDLIDAYDYVANAYQLVHIDIKPIIQEDTISFEQFMKSSKPIIPKGEIIIPTKPRTLWTKHITMILLGVLDLFGAILTVLSMGKPVDWMYLTQASSTILIINLFYLLLPDIFAPIESIAQFHAFGKYYRRELKVKLSIYCFAHIAGYVLQVAFALRHCIDGCSRKSIRIVPSSSTQVVISWSFFANQGFVWSGVVLLIFVLIMLKIDHPLIVICVAGLVIVHCSMYSILIVPFLIVYVWQNRFCLVYKHNMVFYNLSIGKSHLKLQVSDKSQYTLATTIIDSYKALVVKNRYEDNITIGGIRNANMEDILINGDGCIKIGAYTQSKLWFQCAYDTKIFFYEDIGILAFIAIVDDIITNQNTRIILQWNVSDIDLVRTYMNIITNAKSKLRHIQINIYIIPMGHIRLPYDIYTRFVYLQDIVFDKSQIDIVSGLASPVKCNIYNNDQHDDTYRILARTILIAKMHKTKRTSIGIFICGSDEYTTITESIVSDLNNNVYGVEFRVFSESLGSNRC